jgi:hypothetical protein
MRRGVVILAALVALAGCGGSESEDDVIGDYCAYGAVSHAQLDGCVDHVTTDQVDDLDTNAAEYARGELDRCLEDAGPFCHDR